MIDGIANGAVREWYPSGERKLEGYGTLWDRQGWVREWHRNGVLKRECVAEHHIVVKETIWDEHGRLISEYDASTP
jgi:antitoxin component YwqK of YwqJK toxin-antitoxin module